jgi:ADP-ribose pyrophosphatase YjhB (NUDIX family)
MRRSHAGIRIILRVVLPISLDKDRLGIGFIFMIEYIWHEAASFEGLHPIMQVSGVCFDELGRILLLKQTDKPGTRWNIPGGHPEAGETPDQTLIREVYEETTVHVGEASMIGYQEVVEAGKPIIYQLRYAALVGRVDPSQIDPAKGTIHERLFVSPEDAMHYIVYPQYREMFEAAVRWFESTRRHRSTQ